MTNRIGIIIGSTRPVRKCEVIADWVYQAVQKDSAMTYELIDLAKINLPFLNEPDKPAAGNYVHEHTKQWSALISSFDGYIFVCPQYNWGYPAPVKNALDTLYSEWHEKPVALVTYGSRGGGRGAAQLKYVFEGLRMRAIERHVEISIAGTEVDELGRFLNSDATLAPYLEATIDLDAQLIGLLDDDQ